MSRNLEKAGPSRANRVSVDTASRDERCNPARSKLQGRSHRSRVPDICRRGVRVSAIRVARIRAVVIQWTGSEDSRVLVPRAADRMILFEDVELDFGQSLLKPDRSGNAGEPGANCKSDVVISHSLRLGESSELRCMRGQAEAVPGGEKLTHRHAQLPSVLSERMVLQLESSAIDAVAGCRRRRFAVHIAGFCVARLQQENPRVSGCRSG